MNTLHPSLAFDMDHAITEITDSIRSSLRDKLKRRGLVVAISGGIDSSVSAALAVEAVGANKVHCLMLPEQDSSLSSSERGKELAQHLGVSYTSQNIAAALDAIGCYQQRDDAIREVFPEYTADWKNKIVITGGLDGQINRFNIVVEDPSGQVSEKRLPLKPYATIVAATNYKQRLRKSIEYFHADRLNYAVVGTPNRLEYDQGFFVKGGDGLADIKPIAHLYKSQVYALAHHLGLPKNICDAIPSTDTYSLDQGQDEFYFALPYQEMDVALKYYNDQKTAADLGSALNVSEDRAAWIYQDIENKRRTTQYLHTEALKIVPIEL